MFPIYNPPEVSLGKKEKIWHQHSAACNTVPARVLVLHRSDIGMFSILARSNLKTDSFKQNALARVHAS